MTFNRFNRRLHLYLAMVLLPWFAMYGLSSLIMSHPGFFARLIGGEARWTPRFEKEYDGGLANDADVAARRVFARRVTEEHGLECTSHVGRIRDGKIEVLCFTFFAATRFRYDLQMRRLKAEDIRFEADKVLVRMHNRSGYHHEGFLADFWAVMVDLVCAGFLIWVASGLYLWWKMPGLRRWGAIALLAGFACFVAFMIGL